MLASRCLLCATIGDKSDSTRSFETWIYADWHKLWAPVEAPRPLHPPETPSFLWELFFASYLFYRLLLKQKNRPSMSQSCKRTYIKRLAKILYALVRQEMRNMSNSQKKPKLKICLLGTFVLQKYILQKNQKYGHFIFTMFTFLFEKKGRYIT